MQRPSSRYCARGHWLTPETAPDLKRLDRNGRCRRYFECERCEDGTIAGRWPPLADINRCWDEAYLDPEGELAADLAAVRAALADFTVCERLRVGLRMQGLPTPFPGGRRHV